MRCDCNNALIVDCILTPPFYIMHQVGTAADTLSQSGTKLADDELIQLDEPLQEYVRLTASLKVLIGHWSLHHVEPEKMDV